MRWIQSLFLLTLAGPAVAQTVVLEHVQNRATVGLYEKFEAAFRFDVHYNNPFDPAEADVRAVFEAPSGKTWTVIAFWAGDPFPQASTRDWLVRFAPSETGPHTYRLLIDDARGRAEAGPWSFTAAPSSRRGPIQLDPYGPWTLRHSSGEPFHPIGHNLCWPAGNGLADYDRWLSRFQQNGLNWSRVWMNPYSGQGLEWLASDSSGKYHGIGRYSQVNSRFFDGLLERAEARGVYFQMCLFSFNELSTSAFSNWEYNPYSSVHGGPLTQPRQFFTDPFARASIRKLLRYVVARWGYSSSVMCWELFNEFNLVTLTDFENPGNWHSEMAEYLHSVDPFGHPVTTSLTNQLTGGLWNTAFWQRPELDLIQEHRYSRDFPAAQIRLADAGTALGKPSLVGEVGKDPGGWDDPGGDAMRQMAWAGALRLSGTMYWWWESIDAVNSYGVYRGLAAYLNGEDWGARGLRLSDFSVTGPSGIQTYGIQSPWRAYVWIRQTSGGGVTGLRLPGLRVHDGEYDVEFWSTTGAGGRIASARQQTSGGALDIAVPDFTGDIAVKVLPLTPEPTVTPLGPTYTPTPVPSCGPGVLVSRHRPAFASSVFGPGFEPGKAVDGIRDSVDHRWVSASGGPHWWYVDLGQDHCLSRVDVYGEQSAGQSTVLNVSGYRIRGSITGAGSIAGWDLLGEFDDPCGAPYPEYDPNSTAIGGVYRYVGLEITRNDGVCGPHARLLEVEVFGVPWTNPTPTPVQSPTPTPTPSPTPAASPTPRPATSSWSVR